MEVEEKQLELFKLAKELCTERLKNMACKIKYLVLVVFFLNCSCGYYSFKGALPSHIKTVAIPLFENNTAYPNVAEDITNMIVDEFISDNSLTPI